MYAEQAQTGAHHERIGLADVVRGLAGRQLDRRDERTARRNDALLGRAGQVGVGRDETRALVDQIDRLENGLVVIGIGLARDDIIRVDVVHHDAGLVQRADQTGSADDICGCVRLLARDEARRGERRGIEVLLADLQTHACQLLLQLERRTLGGVGQEQKALVFPLKPRNEVRYARKETVAVIDDTVHIADKAFLFAQKFQIFSHSACSPFGRSADRNAGRRRNSFSHSYYASEIRSASR